MSFEAEVIPLFIGGVIAVSAIEFFLGWRFWLSSKYLCFLPQRSASAQQLRSFWRFCRLTDAAYRLRVKRNGRKEQLVKCGFAPPIFIGLP